MTTTKERVLEAADKYISMKPVLEILYPEAFIEEKTASPETGKWYKDKNSKSLIFYGSGNAAYGFSETGSWFYLYDGFIAKWTMLEGKWELAKTSVVEEYLIEEAEKRGFKSGVKFKTLEPERYKTNHTISDLNEFRYYYPNEITISAPKHQWRSHGGTGCSNPLIYKNGVWAEIVSTPLEVTLEEVAKKFGVESVIIK